MSHLSRIKTSICNISVLRKTLEDLGFECLLNQSCIKDIYGNLQDVDLVIRNDNKNMLGFVWDGNEYNLVADLQLWDQSVSVRRFIDKVTQQYALNFVLKEGIDQGFNSVKQEVVKDGTIKLVIQRWC